MEKCVVEAWCSLNCNISFYHEKIVFDEDHTNLTRIIYNVSIKNPCVQVRLQCGALCGKACCGRCRNIIDFISWWSLLQKVWDHLEAFEKEYKNSYQDPLVLLVLSLFSHLLHQSYQHFLLSYNHLDGVQDRCLVPSLRHKGGRPPLWPGENV